MSPSKRRQEKCQHISMVSCRKGPTRHAYAWQIGPFWQDALDIYLYNDQGHLAMFMIQILLSMCGFVVNKLSLL